MRFALVCALPVVAITIHIALADGPADYEIRVPESEQIPLGETGSVSLTIAPAEGFTISKDAPLIIRLAVAPSDGLSVPRKRYARRHAADARADAPRFDLKVAGKTAGEYVLNLDIRFWVCRKNTCRPIDETRRVEVTVPAPPPPMPDAGPPRDAIPTAG